MEHNCKKRSEYISEIISPRKLSFGSTFHFGVAIITIIIPSYFMTPQEVPVVVPSLYGWFHYVNRF